MEDAELFKELMTYSDHHELCEKVGKTAILDFQTSNSIVLPSDLIAVYEHFDGGEIFIPGTVIYGLKPNDRRMTLREANAKTRRSVFSIPNHYLIFAKLNFGDLLCINLNDPYDVIQWDHENDEQYCTWPSIFEWLKEAINCFKEYEAGAE